MNKRLHEIDDQQASQAECIYNAYTAEDSYRNEVCRAVLDLKKWSAQAQRMALEIWKEQCNNSLRIDRLPRNLTDPQKEGHIRRAIFEYPAIKNLPPPRVDALERSLVVLPGASLAREQEKPPFVFITVKPCPLTDGLLATLVADALQQDNVFPKQQR